VRLRKVLLVWVAVATGAALAAGLLNVLLDLGDKVGRELRSYGANISVIPEPKGALRVQVGSSVYGSVGDQAYIDERQLVKIKQIFWRNNIRAIAPLLSGPAELIRGADPAPAAGPGGTAATPVTVTGTWVAHTLTVPAAGTAASYTSAPKEGAGDAGTPFETGIRQVAPYWQVKAGSWPAGPDEALAGSGLASRLGLQPGDRVTLRSTGQSASVRISGILTTGDVEEGQIITGLETAQAVLGLPGKVGEVRISALTVPEGPLDQLDPAELTPKQYERLVCRPTVAAINAQIQQAIPGVKPRAVGQVSRAESRFLIRVQTLLLLVTVLSLVGAALGVLAAMSVSLMERRREVAIMKAIGADNRQVMLVFLAEAGVIGLLGGAAGYFAGLGLAEWISRTVFQMPPQFRPGVLPATLALAVAVALLGSWWPVWRAAAENPVLALKGE
jgi:putative ABC transport system permease protein